jgi:hypothetical protein
MGDDTWSNDCYNSSVSIRLAWQFGEENIKTHKKRRR